MPGISDGFMVYVLAFISLIYVSPILNMKLGIMGNTINQFIIVCQELATDLWYMYWHL